MATDGADAMHAGGHRDPTRAPEARADDLLGRLTLEEKAGLLFHTGVNAPPGEGVGAEAEALILGRRLRHLNVMAGPTDARAFARWHNALQALALGQGHGIPLTLSSDPRHAFTDNPAAALTSPFFSKWPEAIGLGAIGDERQVRVFADIVRQEYVAVGLRTALHPQADIATEPRWARIAGTFGEEPGLVSRLTAAYVSGLQADRRGNAWVSAMVKHFPGGGPQRDGEDPHFAYGREQVYPGGRLSDHLRPFEAAIAAGVRQVMPSYGMPVGTALEPVGFAFNREVVTTLLRQHLGFDGIVCTDWGLVTDAEVAGDRLPARAWGVEDLDRPARVLRLLEAGVDQLGGEACPEIVVALVRAGRLSEARIDLSVRRLLREKFALGLFALPFVDADAAGRIAGAPAFRRAGEAAQRASITLLRQMRTGADSLLPLRRGSRVYSEGLGAEATGAYARPVLSPEEADIAIVRLAAPYEPRAHGLERHFHAGSLAFGEDLVRHLEAVARAVPTVVVVHLDRPAVLTPILPHAAALLADFGAADEAVLDVLFGAARPRGRLPFDLPSSLASVREGRSDVPFDRAEPLFRFGFGLAYEDGDR